MPQLLLELKPNCGQAEHWRVDCPTLPRQSKVSLSCPSQLSNHTEGQVDCSFVSQATTDNHHPC